MDNTIGCRDGSNDRSCSIDHYFPVFLADSDIVAIHLSNDLAIQEGIFLEHPYRYMILKNVLQIRLLFGF